MTAIETAPRLCRQKVPLQQGLASLCQRREDGSKLTRLSVDIAVLRRTHLHLSPPTADSRLACALQSSLFQGLSLSDSKCIACHARELHLSRRQTLLHQGEPERQIFLIASGRVKVTRLGPTGNEVILWLNGPGDYVGGLGQIPGSSNESGAHAIEPCHLLLWDARIMKEMRELSPILQRNTTSIFAKRLDDLQNRFFELATEKVALRLARTLIRLLGSVALPAGEVARINLSREELAQMTGTTLFAVSRLLSEWTQRGIIDARREMVLVHDDTRLLQLSKEAVS